MPTPILLGDDYLVDTYGNGGEEEESEDDGGRSEAALFYDEACLAVVGADEL